MYKSYHLNAEDKMATRSSTDGFQPKFIVDKGTGFLKVQCQIGRTLRNDWMVEYIASNICKQLGIYVVNQKPCHVYLRNKKGIVTNRMGVVSPNFEIQGNTFISFTRLLELNNIDIDNKFIHSNAIGKIKIIADSISNICNIKYDDVLNYVFNMTTVDLLILNQDRHLKNFGVFYNKTTKQYDIARIFDFGMGLFENDPMFDNMSTLDEALRYSYIAPYGEDPFELLDILLKTKEYKTYLKHLSIKSIKIDSKLFPNKLSKEYYKQIKGALINGSKI